MPTPFNHYTFLIEHVGAVASFFSSIGLAEELSSGVRNLEKFSMIYSSKVPTLCDATSSA